MRYCKFTCAAYPLESEMFFADFQPIILAVGTTSDGHVQIRKQGVILEVLAQCQTAAHMPMVRGPLGRGQT
jgi:hypothetical protein